MSHRLYDSVEPVTVMAGGLGSVVDITGRNAGFPGFCVFVTRFPGTLQAVSQWRCRFACQVA